MSIFCSGEVNDVLILNKITQIYSLGFLFLFKKVDKLFFLFSKKATRAGIVVLHFYAKNGTFFNFPYFFLLF